MSSTEPCNCDQSLRLTAWLRVLREDMSCYRNEDGECVGIGYCPQATAAAALDGLWPEGMGPDE